MFLRHGWENGYFGWLSCALFALYFSNRVLWLEQVTKICCKSNLDYWWISWPWARNKKKIKTCLWKLSVCQELELCEGRSAFCKEHSGSSAWHSVKMPRVLQTAHKIQGVRIWKWCAKNATLNLVITWDVEKMPVGSFTGLSSMDFQTPFKDVS